MPYCKFCPIQTVGLHFVALQHAKLGHLSVNVGLQLDPPVWAVVERFCDMYHSN